MLNLVIPPDMDPRKEWFPRHYEPSILLTRDQVESFKLPTDPAPVGEAEAAGAPTIVVGRYIGHDIAYDLHYASLRVGGVDAPGLVVRMIDFAHHTTSDVPIIEKTIATELGHWAALERLQGSAIPRLGGVFVHGTLVCQVFEDAGVPIPPEERLQQRVRWVPRRRLRLTLGTTLPQPSSSSVTPVSLLILLRGGLFDEEAMA